MTWSLTWPPPRTLILAGVIAAVVLLLVGAGTLWYMTGQRAAAAAYADALAAVRRSRTQNSPEASATAARQLESTLQQYPSGSLAATAAYELGNLRYDERQYGTARSAFGIAVARGTGTIRTLARAGVGYSWEAEKDYAKAAEAFQSALDATGPGEFFHEQLALDLARTQELAGQRDRAIQTYRRLLKDVPKSPRGSEIRARLASLGAASQ